MVKACLEMNTAILILLEISKNIYNIFLAQILRKLDLILENGCFENSTPPQTAINGCRIYIYDKHSENAFRNSPQYISFLKIKKDMTLLKQNIENYLSNDLILNDFTANNGD